VPTYQYACTDCEHRFEAVQAFTEDSLSTCPECGGRLRKVYGSVGVVFKGSGFYRTDSRAASSDISVAKGSEKSEKSEKSGAADKPAAKGEKSGERKNEHAPDDHDESHVSNNTMNRHSVPCSAAIVNTGSLPYGQHGYPGPECSGGSRHQRHPAIE